jgi:hypothetical protein
MMKKLLLIIRSLFYSTQNNRDIAFFDDKKVSSFELRSSSLLFASLFVLFSVNIVGAQAASSTWALTSNGISSSVGNVTSTTLVSGSGITASSAAYNSSGVGASGWDRNSIGSNDYFQFSVTPNANTVFNISNIKFDHIVSLGTGWSAQVYYSTDVFVNSSNFVGAFTPGTSPLTFNNNVTIPVDGTTLTFRIYAWNSGGASRILRIKNIVISGTTCAQANAGPDQYSNNSSFTLAANTPASGATGTWSIASGPNTSTSQFNDTSSTSAIFSPIGSGTWVLNWTTSNGVCSSTDQVVITNCSGNLITNGDFAAGGTGWSAATSVPGSSIEINSENTYFSTNNGDYTAELDSQATLRQAVTLIPNVPYTVTFLYAKRPGTLDANVAVDIKIIGGSDITSKRVTTNNTVNPVMDSFTFTPTSSSIWIEFYNSLATSTYGAIIDNIVLLPASQVVPVATTTPKGTYKTLTACSGASVQLDVENISASDVTYLWSGSAAATFSSTTSKNPTVTFSSSGVVEKVTVVVTTAGGCASSPSSTFVNVIAAPTVFNVTGAGSYCFGGSGVSVGLNNSTSGISYQLQKDGVNIGSPVTRTTSGSINFGVQTAVGSYTVIARNTITNCTSNMNGVVIINTKPVISDTTTSACSGIAFSFSPSGVVPAGTTYTWTTPSGIGFSGGAASGGAQTNISGNLINTITTTTATAVYTITPTANGCSGSSFKLTVTINPLPTITVGTIVHVSCANLGSVTLNNLPSGNWKINQTGSSAAIIDNPTSSTTSYTVTGLSAGNYYFSVNNGTCTSTQTGNVVINDVPSTIYNAGAWSNGLPTATKNVTFASAFPITADLSACACTINSGVSMTVPSGRTLNITNALTVLGTGSLVFDNNASLVQGTGTTVNSNIGNITYKRNTVAVRRYDFTYWSSPVSGFTLHDLSPGTPADMYQSYDPFTGWVSHMNGADAMTPGVGYIVRAPESNSLTVGSVHPASFVGVPNNGTVNVTPIPAKWNLVGNPYPSALDAVKFIQANTAGPNPTIVGTLYFWTHNTAPANTDPAQANMYFYTSNDYSVFNLSGSVATREALSDPTADPNDNIPKGSIASGQGFFLKALTNTPIKFTNDMRISGANNSQFFKTNKTDAVRDRLWLNFKNDKGAFKQVLIGYFDEATNSFDNNYDATTLNGNPYVDFYSVNEAKKLTIQGRALPFENSDLVPLGYRSTLEGEFTIAIDHTEGIFNGQTIYLEDKKTGVIHNLNTSNYNFNAEIGTFTDRFVLRYTNKTLGTGDFENIQDGILVSVKNKVINVISSKENIKEVTIFDITGKLIYSKKKVSNTELQIQNLPSGNQVLLVKVTLENDFTATRKIIFQ